MTTLFLVQILINNIPHLFSTKINFQNKFTYYFFIRACKNNSCPIKNIINTPTIKLFGGKSKKTASTNPKITADKVTITEYKTNRPND
jgi:hypothetical protein